MNEEQLTKAMKASLPQPPDGFAERSEYQLQKLTAQEEKGMRKTGVFILAAILLLTFTTALAAGIIVARRGLEESLNVDEETKQSFEGTALFDEPNLSVTDGGVTVTLEECVVDSYAAYVAFRVRGYTPSDADLQPDFNIADYDFGVRGHSGSSSFYNWFKGDGGEYREDYYDENGEMLYIISLVSSDEMLPGNTVRVKFRDLGVIDKKADVRVEVRGTWAFEWELKGTDERVEKQLSRSVGDSSVILTHVLITPVHMEVTYKLSELSFDEDGLFIEPVIVTGIVLDDGSIYQYVLDGGMAGYTAEDDGSGTVTQKNALNRLIRPEDVAGLIFLLHESGEFVEVPIK